MLRQKEKTVSNKSAAYKNIWHFNITPFFNAQEVSIDRERVASLLPISSHSNYRPVLCENIFHAALKYPSGCVCVLRTRSKWRLSDIESTTTYQKFSYWNFWNAFDLFAKLTNYIVIILLKRRWKKTAHKFHFANSVDFIIEKKRRIFLYSPPFSPSHASVTVSGSFRLS